MCGNAIFLYALQNMQRSFAEIIQHTENSTDILKVFVMYVFMATSYSGGGIFIGLWK